MMDIRIGGLLKTTFVNGPGVRYAVFMSGCHHNCQGCHNKPLQEYDYGKFMATSEIVYDINRHKNAGLIDGVTISGGEPFDQPQPLEDLIYELIHSGISNIWVYTGYTYEQVVEISPYVLKHIDVLVDGKFDENLLDLNLKYRGSSNQRIIDLKSTITNDKVITINY